ncbi:MAG: ABC transporter ATP-binding protein [Cytophagaceae bacterium]|nr:ABC transporter ATP-binding protein [Cytophagaceae bacterium]MDW8455334.1 ABC transporter ATP-binding protein [Cytophagaceae bacterium]
MLEAIDLYKAYPNVQVLKGVSLRIAKGEVVSIVGASGAGKSTLLHILGTLDRPDRGKLLFDGEEITGYSEQKLSAFRNKNMGFVFQFHNLLPEFTALENVCIPGLLGRRNKKEVSAKAKHLLHSLGLEHRMHHRPGELSGGEQQRVSVARALINDPMIIFADEPTGNLDSHNAEEINRLFFSLRDQLHISFVIVTHNERLAAQADRMLAMQDGRLQ